MPAGIEMRVQCTEEAGYYLSICYSRNYQAFENHYYLIRWTIDRTVSGGMERIWKKAKSKVWSKTIKRMMES